MHKFLKTINKFNGNICFVGATDSGDVVFECDRQSQVLTYDFSSKLVTDVCLYDESSYAIAFSDTWIGRYAGGVLNENFINTGLSRVTKVVRNTVGEFYIFNSLTNELVKYDGGIEWTYVLPDYSLRGRGCICLRESDSTIIYYNNENIHVVRDDLTKGTLLKSLSISTSSDNLRIVIGGEFNPAYTYLRARTVSPPEILQSSSSSSESSSSVSSSSSSSYVQEWSSSSLSFSSSSLSSSSSSISSSSSSSSSSYIENRSSSSRSSSSTEFRSSSSTEFRSSSSSSYICEDVYCVSGGVGVDGNYIRSGIYFGRAFYFRWGSPSTYIWTDTSFGNRWIIGNPLGGSWKYYHSTINLSCPDQGVWLDIDTGLPSGVTCTAGPC